LTRRCTVCMHPQRADIDKALIGNDMFRNISLKYGISIGSLQRHKKNHLMGQLAEVQRARDAALHQIGAEYAEQVKKDVIIASDLLDQIQELRYRAVSLLNQAELSGDFRTALAGIREARECIELMSKIIGQLDESPKVETQILLNPQWIELRAMILNALELFPEAKEAVLNALRRLDA